MNRVKEFALVGVLVVPTVLLSVAIVMLATGARP